MFVVSVRAGTRRAVVRALLPLTPTAIALLAGCSAVGLSSDKIDYGRAPPQRPLDVPPDLAAPPPNERFAVPGVASALATQQALGAQRQAAAQQAAGATAVVAPAVPNARIERAGGQRWLAVDVPPERAYAVVREFWQSLGLKLEREDPELGILETEWKENRAKIPQDIIRRTIGRVFDPLYSSGEQDRYRTRIERTPNNTSEIYITHRGMVEVYTSRAQDDTRWQPRPSDPELEAEMLQRLMLRFAPAPQVAAVAGAAPAAPAPAAPLAPQAVRVVSAAGGSLLEIDEPFDRAWRRVGLGLDRGGFTVEDRDRSAGLYYVRYLDPEVEARQREKQGLLSRIFGSDPKIAAQQFRIQVAASGSVTTVRVLDKDGLPASNATAEKIVRQLSEQLR